MKILKYQQDIRSLFFLSIALVLLTLSSRLEIHQMSVTAYLMLLTFGAWVVFLICLLNHNHQHNPMFYSPTLNKIINILISFCIGAPSTRLHLVHHFNHHRHYQGVNDWSCYRVHAKGRGLFRILFYFFSASREIAKNRNKIEAPLSLKKQQRIERAALWIFAGIFLWFNPSAFLILILPVWIIGLGLLLTSNLFNHDKCDLESTYNHSRSFTGVFENWLFLNNGFHHAHHEKPRLHWTLLPDLHKLQFQSRADKKLMQNSFFIYSLKYIFKNEI